MAVRVPKPVYKGYMPIDLPQHRPRNRIRPWHKVLGKPTVTLYPKEEKNVGYSEKAEYPPLNDATYEGLKSQVRYDWYDSIKVLPTVEQKLFEINRHTSHRIAHINNWPRTYNSLPKVQYLTRTHLIESLPKRYTENLALDDESENSGSNISISRDQNLLNDLRQLILNQVALDKYESMKKRGFYISQSIRDGNRSPQISNNLVQNIANTAKKALALNVNEQLLDYKYDLSPAIRSWWYSPGNAPPNEQAYYRSRVDDAGNINQMIQMDGSAAMTSRSDKFLEPVLEQEDSLITDTSVITKQDESLKYQLARYKFKWPVALAGFWFKEMDAGLRVDCPHTCFLNTDCLRLRQAKIHKNPVVPDDTENCLNSQAILSAYGWLNSLSMYHGFTPFQELEYPFTCHVITTDGQNWLFNVYQLNSHSFHRDFGEPKKNNICWSSGVKQLYQEYRDGSFVGVNDQVIQLLINFMAQKSSASYTSQLNLRPHLGEDGRTQEEKDKTRLELRKLLEGRYNKWMAHYWKVPLWEHLFFRSKENRNRITFMKPAFHIPKPKTPKIFQ